MARPRSWSTAGKRARLAARRLLRRGLDPPRRPPIADVVATRPLRCLVLAGPRSSLPRRPIRGSCTGCSRRRPAGCGRRTDGGLDRATDAGRSRRATYPVVVIGSGPGALQVSYALRRTGDRARRHLRRSVAGRDVPRWPFFQRLLSWTKPHAPAPRARARTSATTGTACSPRNPEAGRIQPDLMDGTSYFPSRPEMEANLGRVRRAGGHRRPLRLPLDRDAAGGRRGRRRVRGRDDRRRVSRQALVVAVGVAEPFTPPGSGWS